MKLRRIINCTSVLSLVLASWALATLPAQAADTVRVITTGKGSPLEWPLFIGMAKGFFKAHNVEIDMTSVPSTSAAMQQITAGSGDLGVGGVTDPIRAIDHGAGLSFLMVETATPPYSLWGKSSIKTIGELKGKTVIVGGAKDITLIYFERMAVPNGLKKGDYDLTYAGNTPARFAALSSGAVDAAILYPPASFKAPAAGYNNLGELSTYIKDIPFTAYAVNTAWAKAHEAAVKGFLQAQNEGVTWFYDKANQKEAIDILVAASGADRGDIEKTYDYFTTLHIYPDKAGMAPKDISEILKILDESKDLEGAADPKRFIDPSVNAMLGVKP
jgi:NitT/TauT family transport system substrate-binding protein